jgi:hypothetical protein
MVGTRDTYRVVGVRADDSQHIMAVRLSYNDAAYLTETLLQAKIFHAVSVESDEPKATRERLERIVEAVTRLQHDQQFEHSREAEAVGGINDASLIGNIPTPDRAIPRFFSSDHRQQ